MSDLPQEVTVGPFVYSRAASRSASGHGWVRKVSRDGDVHRVEADSEVRQLVDEVVHLRALCEGRADEILRLSDEIEKCGRHE